MYFLTFFWLNEQILGKSRSFQLFLVNEEVSGSDDPRVKNPQKILSDKLTVLLCVGASGYLNKAADGTQLVTGNLVSGDCLQSCHVYTDNQKLVKYTFQVCFLLPSYHV